MKIILPLWVAAFLPQKLRESQIKARWSIKSDEEILHAHKDAQAWLSLLSGKWRIDSIADDCEERLKNYILPEMESRGLSQADDDYAVRVKG